MVKNSELYQAQAECKICYFILKSERIIKHLNDTIEIFYCKRCNKEFTEYQVIWNNFPDFNYYIDDVNE